MSLIFKGVFKLHENCFIKVHQSNEFSMPLQRLAPSHNLALYRFYFLFLSYNLWVRKKKLFHDLWFTKKIQRPFYDSVLV